VPKLMTAADMWRVRQLTDPQVSPAGTVVAFTVATPDEASNTYRRNVWLAPVSPADGPPYPFTASGADQLPRWSPDGRRLAFVSAVHGAGKSEIFVLPAETGGERIPVCAVAGPISELAWSPDGGRLAFVARDPDPAQYGALGQRREGKDMPPRRITRLVYRLNGPGWTVDQPNRIFVVPADGSAPPRSLAPGPFQADGLAWSPDGSKVAFAAARHDTWDLDLAIDLWTVVADGTADQEPQPERVTETGPGFGWPSWSPDGTRLAYYVTSTPLDRPRHRQVGVIDIATGKRQELTLGLDRNCAPFGITIPPTWIGDRLLFGVEDAGNVHLYRVPAAGSEVADLVAGGTRWISEWHWAAGRLAFIAADPASTGELVVAELAAGDAGGAGEELTRTSLTRPFTESVSLGEPVRFLAGSADGSQVGCWAIPPAGVQAGISYPTLLNVHGGPFTQYGNRFTDDFQLQAAAGFGVLYCNPRGSSGYAESWGRAIRWPECENDPGTGWGTVDFDDVLACAQEAARRFAWVDPGRLGILGGSYGGYMTTWAVGHTQLFKAACSERACNNLLTMEYTDDSPGFLRSYVGADHLTAPEIYRRHSPVSYVREITVPLLIMHSEDDLRCPISQAEELFVALRLLGREPELVRFPAESHELTRSGAPAHRVARAELILDWFREHL
jgi:dipeptidyl aminopeptidase/acylaminoacyl peptidase